jgi:hypothetical protein
LIIRWYDYRTNLVHPLYVYEHDERITIPPAPLNPMSIMARVMKTRQPVIWNTQEEGDEIAPVIAGTDASISGVAVPVISSDRVIRTSQLPAMW